MSNIYKDGTYLDYNSTWHEEDSAWKALQINKLIEKNAINVKSICEVGCGAGEIINNLSELLGDGIDYVGYEISPQAFNLCEKKKKNNLKYYLEDLLAIESKSYDLVLAIDVVEHIEDYFGFLRKLKEKGEYKIFHVPLEISVQSIFRNKPILHSRKSCGHIQYFTKDTILATLEDTGYKIIDCFYTCGSIDLPNRGWKADLLRIPRKYLYLLNADLTVRLLGGFSLIILAK